MAFLHRLIILMHPPAGRLVQQTEAWFTKTNLPSVHFYNLYNPEDNMLAPQAFTTWMFFYCYDVSKSHYYKSERDDPLGAYPVKNVINVPFNYDEYSLWMRQDLMTMLTVMENAISYLGESVLLSIEEITVHEHNNLYHNADFDWCVNNRYHNL